jgi:hypothetical protein
MRGPRHPGELDPLMRRLAYCLPDSIETVELT